MIIAVNFFVEDIPTLVDPDATTGEWFLALGNTFIKPVKIVDKASDIAGNAKKAKNADEAKDSSENLTKGTVKTEKQTLYHYTSEEGLKGITSSNKLNPSLKANNPKDARHGDGQYLTDIAPGSKTSGQLSRQFFGIPFLTKRVSHYIEIDVSGLNVVKGRDGVHLVPNDNPLDLSGRIVPTGKN